MTGRPANQPARNAGGRAIVVLVALSAMMFAAVFAAPAMATPKGAFAVFSDCPTTTAENCLYAKTESGKIVIGKETVPIEKAIVLQGGFSETASGFAFVGAKDGNTLVKAPQKVPGGLSGLVKCNEISNFIERAACELLFENGTTGVTATTELAAPASSIGLNLENLLEGTGTALTLPVKVKLENPLLGSSCYVGSNSSPITINLTTGTSGAFTGAVGELEFAEEAILRIKHNSLVNGTFSAPVANGCGGLFAFAIDPIIDSRLGLPSGSGKNAAVLNGTLQSTAASAVKAHE